MNLPRHVPLVAVTRGGRIESVHHGSVVVSDPTGEIVWSCGDPDAELILRSTGKPFQAATLVESGAAAAFELAAEELAIAVGSHGGAPEHVAVVSRLMQKSGVEDHDLGCGLHPPFDRGARAAAARSGFTVRQNNCSGKHAAMLAGCRHLGLDRSRYLEPDHPWQQRIATHLARWSGVAQARIATVVDGCSAPSFVLPLRAAARAYAALIAAEDPALGVVSRASLACPRLIAGEGRLETELMERSARPLIAKSGAEGVYALAWNGAAGPLGAILKIADGDDHRARTAVALAILSRWGVLDLPALGQVRDTHLQPVTTLRGAPVGQVSALFDECG